MLSARSPQSRSYLFGSLFVPSSSLPSHCPQAIPQHYRVDIAAAHMIRRNPTLIPLSDLEVQDVRDLYNKQKAEREKNEELLRKIKAFCQNPELLKEDPKMLESLEKFAEMKQKDKKQDEKAKRLGLDKGESSSKS